MRAWDTEEQQATRRWTARRMARLESEDVHARLFEAWARNNKKKASTLFTEAELLGGLI